ncbi:winged helix-turn-helix domain-containing protein [Thermoflavimicrobium dichotomicum]|uniref:Winged helix-turn-helix DNA-binding n=1 Tax=Thermoflavimicrobium dichotomicum TaxID=46223 RepID=A0A1I3T8A7_9BACL|nr:winged helix-turn-helix domain-containing protein [Thermoflavimicrobium dichotomicum]SFJ65916.1 Winged helix-turn-helix DNA-binding [Thermoflavimicrobium dichotomicum]
MFVFNPALITKSHKKQIGPAIWELLWCISQMTQEVEQSGSLVGIVCNGQPIRYAEIAEDLGISESTVKRNMKRLEQHNYIFMKRAPYGERIYINLAMVRQGGVEQQISQREDIFDRSRFDEEEKNELSYLDRKTINNLSILNRKTKIDPSAQGNEELFSKDSAKMIVRESKNDRSIKEIIEIEEDRKREEEKDLVSQIEQAYLTKRGVGMIPTPADYQSMASLIVDNIPLDDILEGIDYAFRVFKPKHARDRIRSFAYCEAVIRDRYARKQAKQQAQKVGKKHAYRIKEDKFFRDGGDYQADSSFETEVAQGYYGQFHIFGNGG